LQPAILRGVDAADHLRTFFGQSVPSPNPPSRPTMMEILNRMKSLSVVYPCRMATVLRAVTVQRFEVLRGRGSDDLTP
jgi:hypothetical protein